MSPADPVGLAHLARQVLTLAGLRDCAAGGTELGGFRVYALDDGVRVEWFTANPLYGEAALVGDSYPWHPQVVLNEELHEVMERAAANILYAAGFTVNLVPRLADASSHEDSTPEVIVTAAPRFRAWGSG